jgi:hypothetical protein
MVLEREEKVDEKVWEESSGTAVQWKGGRHTWKRNSDTRK